MAEQTENDLVDVLAVIRAPLEQYPPSVYQVELLARSGLRVAVVDLFHPKCGLTEFRTGPRVERIHAARHTLSPQEPFPPAPVRLWRRMQFALRTRRALNRRKPKVVIGYDAQGCHAVGRVLPEQNRPRFVCHIHDLPAATTKEGLGTALSNRNYLRFAREADLVIHPDGNRARHFQEQAGLSKPPVTVMNCPLLFREIPANTLRKHLGNGVPPKARTVFFQGWVGPDRGLETLVQSMKHWPDNAVLVLVGPVNPEYRQSLLVLAGSLNVAARIIFVPMVPLADLPAITAGADLAWGAFPAATEDVNFKFMAGASNKRFLYMALGIAQLANHGPGVNEIIERPRCGRLVDPDSAEDVGQAVAALLADDAQRMELGRNGRQAHLTEFNYEHQFAPVLEQIVSWCKS